MIVLLWCVAAFAAIAVALSIATIWADLADRRRMRAREGLSELDVALRPELLDSEERAYVARVEREARRAFRKDNADAEGHYDGIDHVVVDDDGTETVRTAPTLLRKRA